MNEIWKCTICGYVNQKDDASDRCPVCHAEPSKYVRVFYESDSEQYDMVENNSEFEVLKPQVVSIDSNPDFLRQIQCEYCDVEHITLDPENNYIIDSSEIETICFVILGECEVIPCENIMRLGEIKSAEEPEINEDIEEENFTDTAAVDSDNEPGIESSHNPIEESELTKSSFSLHKNDLIHIPANNKITLSNHGDYIVELLLIRINVFEI